MMAYFAPITAADDWRNDRRARCILKSIATIAPPTRTLETYERFDRNDEVFIGYRVEVLLQVREQIVGAQLAEAEAKNTADVALIRAIIGQIGVQDAVAEAVRIPVLRETKVGIRQLDPAVWGRAFA